MHGINLIFSPFIGYITISSYYCQWFWYCWFSYGDCITIFYLPSLSSCSLTLTQLKHCCLDPVSHVDNGCPLSLTFRILWHCPKFQLFLVFLQYSCFSCDIHICLVHVWSDYDDHKIVLCFNLQPLFKIFTWGCCSCLACCMYHLYIFFILYMHIENILNITGTDKTKNTNTSKYIQIKISGRVCIKETPTSMW